MVASFPQAFRRLERAGASDLARRAREVLACEADWAAWIGELNRLHVAKPEREVIVARAMAAAAGRSKRSVEAARLRVVEGRALQRSGSPVEAARVLERAARTLDERDRPLLAAQARVLRVDALAVAGRAAEAVVCADVAAGGLRGKAAAPWRVALDVNRGNALRLQGELRSAVRVYERAAKRARALGDDHTAAIARTNAAVAWMDAGEAERAAGLLADAAAFFERAGQTDMAAEVRANLASALVRSGRLGDGLATLDRLEEEHRGRGLRRRAAVCAMDLADAFLRAGDRDAAEKKALAAAEDFRAEGARGERVEALWIAAAAARDVDPARAGRHLRRARDAAIRHGRTGLGLRCELLLHDLALRRGKLPATADLKALRTKAGRTGQAEVAAGVRLLEGEAALRGAKWTAALRHFRAPDLRRPGRPWIRLAADTGRALAEAGSGHVGPALRRLRAVAGFLDAVRGTLPGAWLRTTFVLERMDPYLARVDLLLGRGHRADRDEAAALLDALAARRFVERSATLREDGRLRQVRARLESLYDRLARGGGPVRGLAAVERHRLARDARELEREAARRWQAAERRGARGRTLDTAAPRSRKLPRSVTAVHLWTHAGRLRGLVRCGEDGVRAFDLGSVSAHERALRRLSFDEDRARRSTAGAAAFDGGLAAMGRTLLGALAADTWTDEVWVVSGADVPDFPLEMLPFDGRPLARVRRLRRVPSTGVRAARSPQGRGRVVIALGEEDLPGIAREVSGLGHRARKVCGAAATRAAVAQALETAEIVHLAGHGFDAPHAPGLGGVRVADGWFSATDVPRRVGADVVVLAACRSGAEHGAAGEAWGGLPRALLAAGARWVLWTTADVEDEVTADLMARFHDAREVRPVPEAFGLALAEVAVAGRSCKGLLQFRLTGMPE